MAIEKNTPNILRREQNGWTTIINSVINGIKNPEALGVYVYLASKDEGWEICKNHLQQHFNKGRDFINKCMSYLKDIGLLEVTSIRNDSGKILYWETVLKNKLPDESQNTEIPYCGKENQNTEKPECGETTLTNNIYIKNKRDNKKNNITKRNSKSENEEPESSPKNQLPTTKVKSDYFDNYETKKTKSSKSTQLQSEDLLKDNPHDIPQEMLEDWVMVRKQKRSPITPTAWKRINNVLQMLKDKAIYPIDAFERMVANGWLSLELSYFENTKPSMNHKTTVYDHNDTSWGYELAKDLMAGVL